MKRFACIFLAQVLLCVGTAFANCPTPTVDSHVINIKEKTSSFPFFKFHLDSSRGELGEIHGNIWELATGIWYYWKNEHGETLSRTKVNYVFAGEASIYGDVYDCNKNLIGHFHQAFSKTGGGADVVLHVYDATGREIARSLAGKTKLRDLVVQSNGMDLFSIKHFRGSERTLSIADTNTVDMRLIVAIASLHKVRM